MEIRDGKIKEDGVKTITMVGEDSKIKVGDKIKGDGVKTIMMVGEGSKIKGDGEAKVEMVSEH